MYVRSNRSMYVCMSKPKIMYSTCNPYLQSVFQYCSRKPASQPASKSLVTTSSADFQPIQY